MLASVAAMYGDATLPYGDGQALIAIDTDLMRRCRSKRL
jgi:LDH2 family malate/lactate/ureidoglycolate dehydrogenase